MPEIKIWDRKTRKVVKTEYVSASNIYSMTPYTLRGPNGRPTINGTKITLKSIEGGEGQILISSESIESINAKTATTPTPRPVDGDDPEDPIL